LREQETFFKAAIACALIAVGLLLSEQSARAQASDRPNVLVIVTDDQRAGISVMPSLHEWFVAGGTRYTQAFTPTPLCCPARASIMTGRYAHNHGVLNNQSPVSLDQDTTIQKILHDGGYQTALFGKFLNQWELTSAPPSFDRWAMHSNRLNGSAFKNDYYNGGLWNVNGTVRQVDTYSTRFVARETIAFLNAQETHDDVPWMIFVAPSAPHNPFTAEAPYAGAAVPPWRGNPATAESDLSDKPPWWQTSKLSLESGQRIRTKQYRTLISVDDLVERISIRLDALGETRSTLAFFLSDNGFLWSEHGRKGKTLPYRESIKIPFFMRWPGHVRKGAADSRLVSLVDVAPTIRAATGLPPADSPPMDGRSLLDPTWERPRLLLEFFPTGDSTTPAWASTWTRELQYIEYFEPGTGGVLFREFYDLIGDHWQLDNRYADSDPGNNPSPASTSAMSQTLASDRLCEGDACP
jgi:arylsulfatase A-like enzyme